ncbi:MAG: 50S ribosomal protein L11 methyltransferase [Candidatus Omnitrophota bacterium]
MVTKNIPSRKTTWEISIDCSHYDLSAQKILKNLLINRCGVDPFKVIEYNTNLSRQIRVYPGSHQEAKKLRRIISNFQLNSIKIRLRCLKVVQWRDRWKKDFHIFALTPRIDIVPTWQKKIYKPSTRRPIFINTATSFGTGLHETTRFMAHLIESCRGRFESFLDIGTGTGILSLVAFLSGAQNVQAIDIDANCIETAKGNFRLNRRLPDKVQAVDFGKMKTLKQFDLIAANLLTDDLIVMKRKIVSKVKPGKFLAVSGISLENLPRLKKTFCGLPLRCLKIKKGRAWAALLYQRKGKNK